MPMLALDIRPTQTGGATPATAAGAYWQMNLTRFRGGRLEPVGGWDELPGVQANGPVRALWSWRDTKRNAWTAIATLGQVLVYGSLDRIPHDITPIDFVAGDPGDVADGYGVGDYGADDYGVPRTPEQADTAPVGLLGDMITLDNYGEDLLVCGSGDGRILQWSPTTDGVGVRLHPVANAPTGCQGVIVTEERIVVALGANQDPRNIAWCSQEDITDWTPTITNSAGDLELRTESGALFAVRVREGVLIFCADDIHKLYYVGAPYTYGLDRVGSGCGPISPKAAIASGGYAWWMGKQTFWTWVGAPQPLACDLEAQVFEAVNRSTAGRVFGSYNGVFPECWWWFPGENATDPDSYVAINIAEKRWFSGQMPRTAASTIDGDGYPLTGDSNGLVYRHEFGYLAAGQPRGATVYAETGDIDLQAADRGIVVRSLYTDAGNPGAVQFHFFGRWATGEPDEDLGTYQVERSDGIIDLLFETRHLRLRIEGVHDQWWQLGRMRLDAQPGSGI